MLAHRGSQPPWQPDGEHHARLGHWHPPAAAWSTYRRAYRAEQPSRPASTRAAPAAAMPAFQQVSGRVDTRRVLGAPVALASHDIAVLPVMSADRRE
jgi:hypothetical protein